MGNQLFPKGMPAPEVIWDQIQLAQLSTTVYAMLPVLGEFFIEEGYTKYDLHVQCTAIIELITIFLRQQMRWKVGRVDVLSTLLFLEALNVQWSEIMEILLVLYIVLVLSGRCRVFCFVLFCGIVSLCIDVFFVFVLFVKLYHYYVFMYSFIHPACYVQV